MIAARLVSGLAHLVPHWECPVGSALVRTEIHPASSVTNLQERGRRIINEYLVKIPNLSGLDYTLKGLYSVIKRYEKKTDKHKQYS
jgi:hypothetical protein